MWIFGYGSLMWDGWVNGYGCVHTVKATLPGYRRAFDKASVRNWGTQQHCGPTLNITNDPAGSQDLVSEAIGLHVVSFGPGLQPKLGELRHLGGQ